MNRRTFIGAFAWVWALTRSGLDLISEWVHHGKGAITELWRRAPNFPKLELLPALQRIANLHDGRGVVFYWVSII